MTEKNESGTGNNSPRWTTYDLIRWKLGSLWPFGSKDSYLLDFKNDWVRHNRKFIISAARQHQFPPELLAGVCWIEVGGDPEFIDTVAYSVRSFDWMGPDWVDRMTITKHPDLTSFGAVSMQVRTAEITLGLNPESVDGTSKSLVIACLQIDVCNIKMAAMHLRMIIDHDGLQTNPPALSEEAIRIAGARYNRGFKPSLDAIKTNTSYGDTIFKRWHQLSELLK